MAVMVCLYVTPTSTGGSEEGIMLRALLTEIERSCVAELLLLSITFAVKPMGVVLVGSVPVIAPVFWSRVRPVGSGGVADQL